MNYDERMQIILTELIKVLSISEIPRNLKSEKQQNEHMKLLAQSINKRFPDNTTPDHIAGTFERAAIKLSSVRKTNTWPTNDAIIKALDASMGNDKAQAKSKQDDIEAAARFLDNTGRAHPSHRSGYIAKQLIAMGLLHDERDAHWRGFDMSDYKDIYRNQRMTMDEWKNHIRILAENIWNCSHEEAERREFSGNHTSLGSISESELPIELLSRARMGAM